MRKILFSMLYVIIFAVGTHAEVIGTFRGTREARHECRRRRGIEYL